LAAARTFVRAAGYSNLFEYPAGFYKAALPLLHSSGVRMDFVTSIACNAAAMLVTNKVLQLPNVLLCIAQQLQLFLKKKSWL
jgi:hypothetical protein